MLCTNRGVRIFCLVVLVGTLWGPRAVARQASEVRGEWELTYEPGADNRIYLQLHRGGDHTIGTSVGLSAFFDLTLDRLQAGERDARFELRGDAGTVVFEGDLARYRGHGTFRFRSEDAFVEALGERGFQGLDPDELLLLALHRTDLDFVDGLLSLDVGRIGNEELIQGVIFDVTPAFAREMHGLGLEAPTFEELVQMRVFDIDRERIEAFADLGYGKADLDQVLQAQIHGVTPEYVRSIRSLGYDPTFEQLVQLRIFSVDEAFIDEMASVGFADLSIEELVQLRVFDIDKAFVEALRRDGVTGLSPEKMVQLRIFDESPDRER